MPKRRITNPNPIVTGYVDDFGVCHNLNPGQTREIEQRCVVPHQGLQNLMSVTDSPGGVLTYIGYALPGTLVNEKGWMIFRVNTVGNIVTYDAPAGRRAMVFRWDQRTQYNYS